MDISQQRYQVEQAEGKEKCSMTSHGYLVPHSGARARRAMRQRWIKYLILPGTNSSYTNDSLVSQMPDTVPLGECFYCDVMIYKKVKSRGNGTRSKKRYPPATDDHVVPRSRGGYQSRLVDCCEDCNNAKAALTLEEFRVVLAFRYGYIHGVEFRFPGEI
jgi:5-methylcytosine-specific restriction endonuclease McrA